MENCKGVRIQFPCEFTTEFLKDAPAAAVLSFARSAIEHEVKCEHWKLADNEIEVVLRHKPGAEMVRGHITAVVDLFP